MTQIEEPAPAGEDPAERLPVVVKKYANRRLYNTESSSYITLDNLADMVRAGRDFVVYDARSGDDITRGVLTQIIVEEESKGRALLPTTFLRQLIGFYGDSLGGIVPRYLEHTMTAIARQQEQMRGAMQQTIGNLLPPGLEEMRRQNIAMMERAMGLFSPFYRPPGADGVQDDTLVSGTHADNAGPEPRADTDTHRQLQALQQEVEQLRHLLAVRAEDTLPGQGTPSLVRQGQDTLAGAPSPGLARPRRKPDVPAG